MELAFLDRLTYRYPGGAVPALRDVTMTIGPGVTLVTGPSGGGKSTFLRVLNGLIPHFHGGTWAGSAVIAGHDVVATPPRVLAREVGFVFQDPERQAVATEVVREVAFALENVGVEPRRIRGRVEEALERVGAGHLVGRRLAELSGGERQRVEVAAAIALRPRILALDEPTSQLDAGGVAAVAAACTSLAREGLALVIAEHRTAGLPAGRGLRFEAGRVSEGSQAVAAAPVRHRCTAGATVWAASGLVAGIAGRPIVQAAALEVRAGEMVALAGPNGGGKTTLLRTMAGVARPLAGTVEHAPGRTSYLPQDPAAALHRPTVAAEVLYTLRLAGRNQSEADAALAAFDLQEVGDRYPRDLSGGQRERAALAALLAGSPRLVLLDEPTRGMDDRARTLLLGALDDLAAAGAGIVVATHDGGLTAAADRVIEVAGGRAAERQPAPA